MNESPRGIEARARDRLRVLRVSGVRRRTGTLSCEQHRLRRRVVGVAEVGETDADEAI